MTPSAHRHRYVPAVVALATLTIACGNTDSGNASGSPDGGPEAPAGSVVDVVMHDIRFDPSTLTLPVGETISFRFTNNGRITHDAFVGDLAAQQEHEAQMAHAGHGGGHADDADAVTVEPGEQGELSHTFTEPGEYEVGCHQPGHYAAGMKIIVTVA